MRRPPASAVTPRVVRCALVLAALAVTPACASRKDESTVNPMTKLGSDRYIQKAIRSSNEGVILLPSLKSERVYELPRLNEIAHGLREPAAECFLRLAIETMEPSEGDDGGFVGVPEGQVKIRARIAPSGEVLRTEVIETGFTEPRMPACIEKAIARQQFPENQSGVNHYIDIVYWVSLGIQADVHTEAYRVRLRREQVAAAVRAKPCLQGRTKAGAYHIAGLNLVDRDGTTLMNRVDVDTLAEPVRVCLARAFRDIRLDRQPESFVRPMVAAVDVKVGDDGSIAVDGERWLELIELEERARLAEREAAQAQGDGTGDAAADAAAATDEGTPAFGPGAIDELPPERPDAGVEAAVDPGARAGDAPGEPTAEEPEPKPRAEPLDPGRGGLKIELTPRGSKPRS